MTTLHAAVHEHGIHDAIITGALLKTSSQSGIPAVDDESALYGLNKKKLEHVIN